MKNLCVYFKVLVSYASEITDNNKTTIQSYIADALGISRKSVEIIGTKKTPSYQEAKKIAELIIEITSTSQTLNKTVLYEHIYDFLLSATGDKSWVELFFKDRYYSISSITNVEKMESPDLANNTSLMQSTHDTHNEVPIISNKPLKYGDTILKREKLCKQFYNQIAIADVMMIIGRKGSGKSAFVERLMLNDREKHHNYNTFFIFDGCDFDFGNMLSIIVYKINKQNTTNIGNDEKELIATDCMNGRKNLIIIENVDMCNKYSLEKLFSFHVKIKENTKLIIISAKKDKAVLSLIKRNRLASNEIKMPNKLEKSEWLELAKYSAEYNYDIRKATEIDPTLAEWIYSLGYHEPEALKQNLNYISNRIIRGGQLELIKRNFEKNINNIVINEKRIQNVLSPLSENEKKIITAMYLIDRPATHKEIYKLTNIEGIDESMGPSENSELEKAIQDCKDKLVIECEWSSDLNEIVLSLPQYYKPYIKKNVSFKNQVYQNVILSWIDLHIVKTAEIGMCFDKIYLLEKYERDTHNENVNIDSIKSVLRFCEENELWDKYYQISYNTRYYFYIRGMSGSGTNNVHIKRAEAAKKMDDPNRECEALLYYSNVCCKRKETENIESTFNRIEELIINYPIDDINKLKFYYVKGLYYFSIDNFSEADKYFDKYLELTCDYNINVSCELEKMFRHDLSTTRRWKCDCLCHIAENNNESGNYIQMIESLIEVVKEEAIKLNHTRAIVHLKLIHARILKITKDKKDETISIIKQLKEYEKIIMTDSYYKKQYDSILKGYNI